MHSLHSFDAHVYCFQVIFGILSICLRGAQLRCQAASAVARTPSPPAGAGNKRVTIVSVRLSLIMKTAATLSLENAFTITDCLAPAWNVTLLSMRLHLFSRQAARQAAASFRSPIAAAIKICSYWLWEEEEQQEVEGDAGREWAALGSRNSISFAHRLQIILQLPNMGMTWGQLLPPLANLS